MPRLRGPREISGEPDAFSGKFGDSRDDGGIVGGDQGLRAHGGGAGRRLRGWSTCSLRACLQHLRRERRARDTRDRLQRSAARQPPLLVILDGFFHQIALQIVHVHLSL